MLKLNLIPRSYYQQRAVRKLMGLMGALLLLVVVAVLGSIIVISSRTAKAQEEYAAADPIAKQVESLRSQAEGLRSEVKPLQERIKFINDVQSFNVAYLPVLQDLIKYTYHTIEFNSVVPEMGGSAAGAGAATGTGGASGVDTIRISGTAPSVTDLGKFLIGMYRANHLFSSVSLSGPSGWGDIQAAGPSTQSGAIRVPFNMTVRLVKPITAPTPPAASAPTADATGGVPGASAQMPGSGATGQP